MSGCAAALVRCLRRVSKRGTAGGDLASVQDEGRAAGVTDGIGDGSPRAAVYKSQERTVVKFDGNWLISIRPSDGTFVGG